MTQHLQHVFEQAQKLNSDMQDSIAAIILEEIGDERKWNEAFARSHVRRAALPNWPKRFAPMSAPRELGIDEL